MWRYPEQGFDPLLFVASFLGGLSMLVSDGALFPRVHFAEELGGILTSGTLALVASSRRRVANNRQGNGRDSLPHLLAEAVESRDRCRDIAAQRRGVCREVGAFVGEHIARCPSPLVPVGGDQLSFFLVGLYLDKGSGGHSVLQGLLEVLPKVPVCLGDVASLAYLIAVF